MFAACSQSPTDVADVRHIFEQLDLESFPTLKEIKMDDIKQPNSECVTFSDGITT
jgi:hypothetical protein